MDTVYYGVPVTVTLEPGETLSVVADASSSGRLFPFVERVGDTPGLTSVSASSTVTLGPFANAVRYQIECLLGSLTYTAVKVDYPTLAESAAAAAALYIPVGAGSIGDVKEYIGAGAPVDYTDGSPPATGEGVAGIGSRYTDATAGKMYLNGGTKAQPIWKIVTSAS